MFKLVFKLLSKLVVVSYGSARKLIDGIAYCLRVIYNCAMLFNFFLTFVFIYILGRLNKVGNL